MVQKTEPVKDLPAVHVAQQEEAEAEKPGFWKNFGNKAKGIFG